MGILSGEDDYFILTFIAFAHPTTMHSRESRIFVEFFWHLTGKDRQNHLKIANKIQAKITTAKILAEPRREPHQPCSHDEDNDDKPLRRSNSPMVRKQHHPKRLEPSFDHFFQIIELPPKIAPLPAVVPTRWHAAASIHRNASRNGRPPPFRLTSACRPTMAAWASGQEAWNGKTWNCYLSLGRPFSTTGRTAAKATWKPVFGGSSCEDASIPFG